MSKAPKDYYSAGTSIKDLKEKTKHCGNIPCATFYNLAAFVFNLIKSKYYKSRKSGQRTKKYTIEKHKANTQKPTLLKSQPSCSAWLTVFRLKKVK